MFILTLRTLVAMVGGAVYDINGIAPTVVTMSGGGNKPNIIIKTKTKENNK